jgi:hypothetical protein
MRNQRGNTADRDDALFDVLHALREELATLRDAIDELREEIQWGNRNREGYNPALFTFHPERLAPLETPAPVSFPAPQRAARIEENQDDTPRRQRGLF